VQYIEKQGRVSSIKKKCKKLQETFIDINKDEKKSVIKKDEEVNIEDEPESDKESDKESDSDEFKVDDKKSIEEDANEKLDKMFKKLKV
jgi:hypothetical protein